MSFPTLELLDSFKRSEEPLSNGGKWKTFFVINNGPGYCREGIDWENNTPAGSTSQGAYWSPIEFSNPGVAITRDQRITDSGYWSLWACMSNPTTAEISGYRLKLKNEAANVFEIKLERCIKNSFTVLSTTNGDSFSAGDRVGLAVQEGAVQYWHKKGAGEWEERASKADATYTKGFVGFAVEAANGNTTNFEAGSSKEVSPTVENPGKRLGRVGKSTSLQIHALNSTKYFATNLPLGLSISESTGLITGEFETEESSVVKIKVENEAKETAETSFEWVVTTRNSNVLNMIVS